MENPKDLKTMLLEMMAWFHHFCVENQLTYYILGGTMLGAARHQGFIPWDDDIDVGMPRQDYLRLWDLMKTNSYGPYVLEGPGSVSEDYFYPMTKLYDTNTTLVENTRNQIRRGIYLDIFPLDGAGNSEEEAKVHFRSIRIRRNLLLAMTTGIRRGRKLHKNLLVMAMRLVPARVVDPKKLLLSIDHISQSRDYEACQWIGNMMGNWMERELMPRRILGTPRAYSFESLEVFGPEDYDGYLTCLYGNWRELPPEDKRRSHHDFLWIDLQRSYLEPREERL